MKRADITDILQERWLRRRDSGELVWKTKGGIEIPIKDLSDDHIENIINNDNKRWYTYDYGEEDL